ncbi:hypothetical protein [Alcanivorax sp.]|uniref:hypothetical protein n=1 Tax=Alcanivorax sp. TaxID=1872427 RepID=UPI003BAD116E
MTSVKIASLLLFASLLVAGALSFQGIQLTMGYASSSEAIFARSSLQFLTMIGHYSAPHMLASMKVFQSQNSEDRREGFLYLEQEAKEGSCYSAGKIGWAYQKGLGVEPDIEKAISLYKQAAECGMTYWQILLSHA